jgi:hypothetical protein
MDGATPVELEAEEESFLTRAPDGWTKLFKLHQRTGKHPYMCSTLLDASNTSAVARAFRNYFKHVYDYDGRRIPDSDYEPPP